MKKTLELKTHTWLVLFNDGQKTKISRDETANLFFGKVEGGRDALKKEINQTGFITIGKLDRPVTSISKIAYEGGVVSSVVEIEKVPGKPWKITEEE